MESLSLLRDSIELNNSYGIPYNYENSVVKNGDFYYKNVSFEGTGLVFLEETYRSMKNEDRESDYMENETDCHVFHLVFKKKKI